MHKLHQQEQPQPISGNAELDAKIREWLAWDQNRKTAGEIRRLVKEEEFGQLEKMLMTRLKFGTAGLRGKLGAGYNAMNDLVVLQTAQGILRYLEECTLQNILESNGIVVGYDGRHGSKRFAEITTAIFLHKGYPVKLFNNVVPTPFVSFAVGKLKCACGIMVTASHNPKEDNGYKVYCSNGAQIVSPTDAQIEAHILQNLEPLESSWDTSIIKESDKRTNPLPDILKSYLDMIKSDIVQEHKDINAKSKLSFTYTAMHGVGYIYFARAMEVAGLKVIAVDEQKYADPNFPTVKFPNPEEDSALDLAIQTAEAFNSDIIIANDPDADRMAAAERNADGKWRIFTGNEIGALLGWWAFHSYQASTSYDPKVELYMLSSSVSSKILRTMCQAEGFNFIETLTGFKWMGNKAHELMQQKKKVIFAFEEAIGYMWDPQVLDKDGIQAGVHLATLAAYLDYHALSLSMQLEEIYQEYGYHITNNSYLLTDDVSIFSKIFHRLRNYHGDNTYPKSIGGGKYDIINVRDLTTGYDSSQPDGKAVLPSFPDQYMITFEFANGLVATLRTSGTEPKLKYYMEMCAKPKQGTREEIEALLADMVYWFVKDFCEPEANGLQKCG